MALTLYGIPNCDTVKKARKWLEQRGLAYSFHDYKKAGITADKLKGWAGEVGWDTLLNRAGTTFKKLPDVHKANIDEGIAIQLMVENPSMIKRPVLEHDGGILVGFKQSDYEAATA